MVEFFQEGNKDLVGSCQKVLCCRLQPSRILHDRENKTHILQQQDHKQIVWLAWGPKGTKAKAKHRYPG